MESKAHQLLVQAIAERNDERGVGGAVKVAGELGCSSSLVSQLVSGKYPKSAGPKWATLIIEKYGRETVNCPVIGEISLERCRIERERPYSMANPTRGDLSRTCPTCKVKP
jgi:DNA-binding transcriptional regulator YdaS (Cro superfamily)